MYNKKLIYDAAFAEAKKFKMDSDNTKFLAHMVVRKIRHPEEKMDVIATIVMHILNIQNRRILVISSEKSLMRLHEKLDESDYVPEELKNGLLVSNVVKKLATEIIENLDEESC